MISVLCFSPSTTSFTKMVKFSKQFEAQLVHEWKEAFVDYCQLKKDIKNIRVPRNEEVCSSKEKKMSFGQVMVSSLRKCALINLFSFLNFQVTNNEVLPIYLKVVENSYFNTSDKVLNAAVVVGALLLRLSLIVKEYSTSIVQAIPGLLLLVVMLDFFMADQLCSQVPMLRNLENIACYYYITGSYKTQDYKFCLRNTFYKDFTYAISFIHSLILESHGGKVIELFKYGLTS